MANPPPIQYDLSLLLVQDRTVAGPAIPAGNTPQHGQVLQEYLNRITKLFNDDPNLVNVFGQVQFIGGLPAHYTLTHRMTVPGNAKVVLVFGHPSGKRFRSAAQFKEHVSELMLLNLHDALSTNRVNHINTLNQIHNAGNPHALNILAYNQALAGLQQIDASLNREQAATAIHLAQRPLEGQYLASNGSLLNCHCKLD